MTETNKALLKVLNDRHDAILDAMFDAEANAMTWSGFVYTVRIWEDGSVLIVERLSGDNFHPACDGWMDVYTTPAYYDWDWMGADTETLDAMTDAEVRECAVSLLQENYYNMVDGYEWKIQNAIDWINED